MKILHVTNAVGWSGGMEQIFLLITELQKRNHTNILVCPPDSELSGRLISSQIAIQHLKMFQDYDLLAAWQLKNIVESESPDVVHAHHPTAHSISLLSLLTNGKPAFIVSRRVSFSLRKNPFSMWKYRSRRIDHYVVVSQSVKETLVRGGVESEKIKVIYSAVNPGQFGARLPDPNLRKELQIPENFSVVGKVANLSLWKGQHIFLKAAQISIAKNPKIIFLLIGKDTETLKEPVSRMGLSNHVKLLGFRKDIPEILSLLDLSVNSAIDGEGLSGALRESLAMGIPVLASDVSGNRELVQDGKTGFLVPPDNPEILSEQILLVLKDPQKAKEMAQKGREWVLENASLEKMVSEHLSLYSSLS